MSVTVFCLCGYYTNNLFTVLWGVPFPVPHRRARAICADTGRNGGDCHCHGWWLVSGRDCRRLLHGSNIQLFHQGVIPWWVSTGFQAIHAILLLRKFLSVSWKEACWIDLYLWSVLGWRVMCCSSFKFIKYRRSGIALSLPNLSPYFIMRSTKLSSVLWGNTELYDTKVILLLCVHID